jgi:hypothetical protein
MIFAYVRAVNLNYLSKTYANIARANDISIITFRIIYIFVHVKHRRLLHWVLGSPLTRLFSPTRTAS